MYCQAGSSVLSARALKTLACMGCLQVTTVSEMDPECLIWIQDKLQLVSIQPCTLQHHLHAVGCVAPPAPQLVPAFCSGGYPYLRCRCHLCKTCAAYVASFLCLQLLHGEGSSEGQAWLEQAWQPAAHQQPIAAFLTSLKASCYSS